MPKTVDILVDNLKETLKSIDLSILLALTASAFIVVHGVEGNFTKDLKARADRVIQERQQTANGKKGDGAKTDGAKTESSPRETKLPFFGFEAELPSAAIVAMIAYWLLSFSAALRVRQARVITKRLADIDNELVSAALLFPSLATSSRLTKLASSTALAALGYASYLSIYFPINEQLGKSTADTMIAAIIMLVPAGFLARQLWMGVDRG